MLVMGGIGQAYACSPSPNPDCLDEECECEEAGNSRSSSSTSCTGCSGGNHVIQASGNLHFKLRPFKLKGIGVPVEPVFAYNSQGAKPATPYGRGWVLNYDRRLKRLKALSSGQDTKLECENGNGGIYTYSIEPGGTTYRAKKRHLLQDSILYASGENYIEEFKDGTKMLFIMSDDRGYISTISDRHGNVVTIERYAGSRIRTITDSSNRTVTFEYANEKLSKIVLPSPGGGAPAPEYLFTCTATLDKYTSAEGAVTEFTYLYEYRMGSRKHAGEEVRYECGDPEWPTKVTKRTRIIDGHTYEKTFTYYPVEMETIVVDEAGFTTATKYDDFGDTTEKTVEDQDPVESRWAADAKPNMRTKVGGKRIASIYSTRGNITYKAEKKSIQGGYETGLTHAYTYVTDTDDLQTDTDSLRGTITYGYDANHNKTSKTQNVTDPDTQQSVAVSWGWTYYSDGLLHTETDPNGNVTTYEYEQYGNPIDIQRKDSQGVIVSETTAVYDALNRMTQKKERIDSQRWRITDLTYDKENRVLKTTYNEDESDYEENTYDCCHLLAKRDRNGNTVSITYYDSGKVWKETRTVDGTSYVIEYGYNGRDELTSRKTYAISGGQPVNVAETTYQYDAAGHKTQVRQKKDASNWIQTDFAYDPKGQLASETRYLGTRSIVTSYEYDNAGRISIITKPIDANTTVETEYEYDVAGRKTKEINALDKETTYQYDELDRLIQVNEPLNRVTKYRYDKNGNKVKVIDALDRTTTYTYNGLNKVASITRPVNEGQITTVTTSYAYDCLGNRTLVTDGNNKQTQYAYNLDGRLELMTDAEGHETEYEYYPAGQLKTLTDADEHVTHYTYDAVGKLRQTKYAYQTDRERTESFTYDNAGNMLTKTLRSGDVISFEYDLLNRQTGKIYPDDSEVEYIYDDLGRMTSVTDTNDETTSYAYDDANNLLSITYPDSKVVQHEYNKMGSRTKLTYTDSSYIEYTYDDLERIYQVKDQNGNVLAQYTNDELRRTRLDYLNGTYATYNYNDADWVTALYNTKQNQGDISSFTYTHDKAGNRATMVTTAGTHAYTYDDIYQLTQVDYPSGHPYSDKTYNLSDVGNRTSVVNGGTVSYTHNELNEYTAVGGSTYTSDLRGNLTSDGSQSYAYDLDNRLTGVGQSISYAYDPFGKRIQKTISGSTTKYIHSGDQIVEEWEGTTLARKYVFGVGIDEPLVMVTSDGSKYYYHFDALGSVRNLTDSSGATATSYEYDVYGAFTLSGSSHGNAYAFTGRQWDGESSLYYYRARYYLPAVGRFIQTDPTNYKDGPNLYCYVKNNAVNMVDPSGLACGPGVVGDFVIQDTFFSTACEAHDHCYEQCHRGDPDGKEKCDNQFHDDAMSICDDLPADNLFEKYIKGNCYVLAEIFYGAVDTLGGISYESNQAEACKCPSYYD
jgi:RHS repeat-associated protein